MTITSFYNVVSCSFARR